MPVACHFPKNCQLQDLAMHHFLNLLFCDKKCSSFIDISGGSIPMLWQVTARTLAVKSLISLWRIEGKPPFGQLVACSTVKLCPQTQ